MNHEIPDVQAGFRKGRGTRDQIANICWITKKTAAWRARGLVSILNQKWQDSVSCSLRHEIHLTTGLLQARLQQYVNRELPDVQAGFRKGRGTRDQIANIRWIM